MDLQFFFKKNFFALIKMSYQCNLCKRHFSRKTNLAQHYNQLHSYLKHSHTLNWIQNQQQLNPTSQILSQIFNDNI